MMGSKAFESPLIPHARMRALFRALVEVRALKTIPRNLEAPYVATAIDLHLGDLTLPSPSTALLAHIRALAGTHSKTQLRRTVSALKLESNGPTSTLDQLLVAAGAALALKHAKSVVIAYLPQQSLSAADWKRLVAVAADLPLIVVSLSGPTRPIASIPVIPVDAGDVVALYRVAQESIGRARTLGGLVVIDCIPCRTDPIKLLAAQLIKKKICTPRWVAAVEPAVRVSLMSR